MQSWRQITANWALIKLQLNRIYFYSLTNNDVTI